MILRRVSKASLDPQALQVHFDQMGPQSQSLAQPMGAVQLGHFLVPVQVFIEYRGPPRPQLANCGTDKTGFHSPSS